MKIISCNILGYSPNDKGKANWDNRKELIVEIIKKRNPDIFCIQEGHVIQIDYLLKAFPGYDIYGINESFEGRSRRNAIFYRQDKFILISAGGYWLSETPHVCGSRSWGSAGIRLANWVRLIEIPSNKEFRVINTHLDHVSQLAREKQAQLINEDTLAYPDSYPQILTGDMNCTLENPALQSFITAGWKDSYKAFHHTYEEFCHTAHEFKGPDTTNKTGRIDWIFFRGQLKVTGAEIIKDSKNGQFPSDHYFISATFEFL